MLDNVLIPLIISTILTGEAIAGISGTPIAQAFQPTQQGVNTAPTAYLYKIGDHPLGMPERADSWDEPSGTIIHVETQDYETTFQISALSTQDPLNQTQYTASDILNLIRSILQSSASIAALQAQGVGVLKIEQVRNLPFVDDFDRHEYQPSLDFTVQHKQIIVSTAPIVASVEIQLDRV